MKTVVQRTQQDIENRTFLAQKLRHSPIPDDELIDNIGIYLSRQNFARIQYMNELYKMILPVHGVIMEFGVRWGQNLSLFSAMRSIYEPYNFSRRIIGFDTFEGFPKVHQFDSDKVSKGDFAVTEHWKDQLNDILHHHEQDAPLSHISKNELVKGDASKTVPDYLERHPETIIAMAYFDFDLYEPTRDCLTAIRPFLTKGTVLAFDELNHKNFPGETRALHEVLGLDSYAIKRISYSPSTSYIVID